ncbi:MAG: OprO/OprP family phosphate-selective porin [Gammaproteobacteria bacterium]|nr:OprO/OprP family phosphate-selective porin [Gammaproteobacteria bacterium]
MKQKQSKGKTLVKIMGGVGLTLASALSAQAATAPKTMEEMWEIIQTQQKELEQLKAQQKNTEQRVEVTSEAVEQQAASGPSWADKTRVGGYGELHYNNLDSKNEIDLHRFVVFLGHEFSDRVRFFSELEVEHTGVENDGDPLAGEVELEQAFVEFDFADKHTARAGLFLVPAGIINETHEPPTFYGVERNPVETNIIPATWWEAGAGVSGELAPGWGYNLDLTSGLETPTTGSSAYKIRNGRQKVSQAKANDSALTGRIKWAGLPGVELAATAQYQSDLTQGTGAAGTASSATLFETHAVLSRGPVGLRALYATWSLDGTGPASGASPGRDKQFGWFIEPSYKLTSKLGAFARYNVWDNNAGSGSTADTKNKQMDLGLNYWPHEDVVLKFDVQKQSGAANDDGFNLGVGYQF